MKREITNATLIAEIAVIETMLIELMECVAGKKSKEDLAECSESSRKAVKQAQKMATMALINELADQLGSEKTEE